MNLGLGIGLGFQRGAAAAESSPLDVITSDNGAWWVVAERDGSNHLVDQTGGGRNLLLPGGSADPVLLDHTGTDYFWFPGTASNTLTTDGLSNSTAYDYKVFYLDGSSATGEETTDGSGVLTLGGTQTNFNVKKVTRIRVVADGADPDVATAVRDILASDADPDATTFAEASANAATVTINRSSTGYKTAVVDEPRYVFTTDDYLSDDDTFYDIAGDESFTAIIVARLHGTPPASFTGLFTNYGFRGWSLQTGSTGDRRISVFSTDGTTAAVDSNTGAAPASGVRFHATIRKDDSAEELECFINSTGTGSPASTVGQGLVDGGGTDIGRRGTSAYAQMEFMAAAFIKGTAWTTQEMSDIADALITANGGTP